MQTAARYITISGRPLVPLQPLEVEFVAQHHVYVRPTKPDDFTANRERHLLLQLSIGPKHVENRGVASGHRAPHPRVALGSDPHAASHKRRLGVRRWPCSR